MSSDQLVSVVIPAYNAEATLDETLRSVRGQTHRALEIIVVDDGSTDGTRALAEQHAAADPRLQVRHQRNAGVAAARNTGWQHARSEFISFIDADDLWAPTKIERQLHALQAAGPRAGLAYTWVATLDPSGVVTGYVGGAHHAGDVLSTILRSNFIACGSNVLVRRDALINADGFDSQLRDAGFEGCEDWLFSCRIAESHHFVSVPEYLVGYRQLHHRMSSDRRRMLRSYMLASRQMIARHPDQAEAAMSGTRSYCAWLMREALDMRNPRLAFSLWRLMWQEHRRAAWRVLWRDIGWQPARRIRDRIRRALGRVAPEPALTPRRHFYDMPCR